MTLFEQQTEETTKPRGRSPSEGLVDKTPKRKRSKSRGPSGGGLLSNLKAFAINQPENGTDFTTAHSPK